MPVTVGETRMEFQAANLRALIVVFVFLVFGATGKTLGAQAVKIKLVNGKSGRPIANTCVNTWVGTARKDAMAIPTDKDGVAWLYLTDKDAQVNIRSQSKSCGDFG